MSAASSNRIVALWKRGWHEVPEIMGSSLFAITGVFMTIGTLYRYYANDGDNRRYKDRYTVYRHDDPRVDRIRKD